MDNKNKEPKMNDLTKYISSEISDIGGRASQQDFLGKVHTSLGTVFIVADGMGGRNGGAIASELAVRSILDNFVKSKSTDPIQILKSSIAIANQLILDKSLEEESLAGMGTTVAILYINDSYAKSLHVGDSRVYQFRDNSLAFKTRDHSKVSEMVANGILSEEDARTHPESNVLTQALGTRQQVSISESDILAYQKFDSFLICSDGIWNSMNESELSSFFSLYDDHPAKINTDLTSYVKQSGLNKANNFDNLTSINIKMMQDSKIKVKVDPMDYLKRNKISLLTLGATILLFWWLWNSSNNLRSEIKSLSDKTQLQNKAIDSLGAILAITQSKILKSETILQHSAEQPIASPAATISNVPKPLDKVKKQSPNINTLSEKVAKKKDLQEDTLPKKSKVISPNDLNKEKTETKNNELNSIIDKSTQHKNDSIGKHK